MNQKLLPTSDVFVGRQPIYTPQLDVFAYELLFRSGEVSHANVTDGNHATAQVLVNTFFELGLDTLVGGKHAFINLTRDVLLQDYATVFPPGRVVFEVLEDIPMDAELLEAVRRLIAQGYTIALDDFIYHDHLRPLVDLADIVKLDVLATDRPTLAAHVARLRDYPVQLLAEKVETHEDFTYCQDLGFEYFQGYFFCKPDVVKGQRMPTSRLAILDLLAKLQTPEIAFDELEALISRDVSLSYRVLRVANSACYARSRTVESIQQALLRLGLRFLTNLVSVLCLANIDDKPHELLTTALVRAKMCEQLAQARQEGNGAAFFTAGLLSVLDAFMDRPLPDILTALPLSEELVDALLAHEGRLGTTLREVLAYERGDWTTLGNGDGTREVLVNAYLEALAWATDVDSTL